jgi:BMFP domain-containing protein YqiC
MRASAKHGARRLFLRANASMSSLKKANGASVHAPSRCTHQMGTPQTIRQNRRAPDWCAPGWTQGKREMNNFFNDLQDKINQAIDSSPAKDIERNVKAMMTQGFSKLDLVTREEFDIQTQVLAKTRAKLDALELRVAELEAKLASGDAKVSIDKV